MKYLSSLNRKNPFVIQRNVILPVFHQALAYGENDIIFANYWMLLYICTAFFLTNDKYDIRIFGILLYVHNGCNGNAKIY